MTWDAAAKKVAIKAIGTVESSFRYDVINYNDPITVGVSQWYGTRAAAILNRMRTENPSDWIGVANSINNDLINRASNSNWWNSRYLTLNEGNSLAPVLANNTAIQDDQVLIDLDDYVEVWEDLGGDKDANTDAMIFFFVMYHQGPVYALQVLTTAGMNASLTRMHAFCLNNSVLGQYTNRYNTARDIIASGDSSGVGDIESPVETETGSDNGTPARSLGDVLYLERIGDHIGVRMKNGSCPIYLWDGSHRWLRSPDSERGGADTNTNDVNDTNPNPIVPPGDITAAEAALMQWMESREETLGYAQAPGRLDPDNSGISDCSGVCWAAYMDVTGKDVGTWTGEQRTRGKEVARGSGGNMPSLSILRPGDLIVINWAWGGHVAMYAGSGMRWDHGSGIGPKYLPVGPVFTDSYDWTVRRHL